MAILNILNDGGESLVRFESSEGKLINLENAHFLNHRLFSNPMSTTNEQFNLACEKLFTILAISGKKLSLKQRTLNNLLSNLFYAASEGKVVSYYRAKNYYSGNGRIGREHFSYDFVVSLIDKLIQHGYVENVNGFYDPLTHIGKISRIWATNKLIHFMHEFNFVSSNYDEIVNVNHVFDNSLNVVQPKFRRIDLDNVMLIHDKIGRYRPSLNSYVKKCTNDIIEYNKHMNEQSVLVPLHTSEPSITNILPYTYNTISNVYCHTYTYTNNTVPSTIIADNTAKASSTITSTESQIPFIFKPLDTFCYRVYNNAKLTHGGRFYGPNYQGESQMSRTSILLNGSESVEIDYSAYHMGMLYNLENMSVSNDPYDLFEGNPLLRKSVKLMFNMLLNSENRVETIKVFNWRLNKDYCNTDKKQRMIEIKSEMGRNNLKAKDILQKIEESHTAISKYFNTGFGRNLQRMDSDIANGIMMNMISQNIPCLVIHDSFIVPKVNADALEDSMKEEYKKKFKFDCKLARK